jgi:hypothetical protein
VVFDLCAAPEQEPDQARLALFTVDLRDISLVSVKVVTADTEQAEARIEDLRLNEATRSLAMPSD